MDLWRRVRFVGPLLPYVAGFAAELAKLGYAERTVDETVRAISHLSKWMSEHRLEVGELTPAVVERFLRDRRRSGRRVRSMVLFGPLLVHLRTVGAIRAGNAPPPTPLDELCDAYSRYLGRERGMVPSTVRAYTQTARNFLRPCLAGLGAGAARRARLARGCRTGRALRCRPRRGACSRLDGARADPDGRPWSPPGSRHQRVAPTRDSRR
jgi:hypothetical protein